jgi:tetratricopeptide (TPR) repeat protein
MLYKKLTLVLFSTLVMWTNLLSQDVTEGIKLIRNEKFNEAKKYFSSLLTSSKKTDANFYLAQIYFAEGKFDSSKSFFLKGINNDKEPALDYAGLVKVNLVQNNISEANKNQNEAIEINDDKDARVYLVLAEAYSNPQIKDYEKAILFLNKALKIDPKSTDSYILLGKIYLNKGNGSDAIKNFENALDISKTNPEALTYKAKVYALIDNNNDAISLLNEAIAGDPGYAPAYNELAELYAKLKDYAKATEYYEKYINISGSTPAKLKRYASMLYINKDYEKAIKILEGLNNSEQDFASALRILAYSYLRLDDAEKSKSYFQKLFELKSADYLPSDYENYADLLSKTGNDSLAVEYLLKIVATDSTRNDILGKISVLSFKNKNWSGVITALEKKQTLTAQEYFDLAKACIFKDDKAISEVMQSLSSKLDLNEEQLGKLRIALLYYQKDLTDAKGDNQKIAAALNKVEQSVASFIEPNQKSKWLSDQTNWIQEVRSAIGQEYAKADSALVMLSTKAPNLAIAYFWRARVNSNFDPESEAGLAKPFYEKFIELAKGEPDKFRKELIESYSYLGYYYYLQKDNVKSKSYWQQVLALDPENNQAIDVLKQLK